MLRAEIQKRVFDRGIVYLMAACFVLQACGTSTEALNRKYADPSDVCVADRKGIIELRSTEEQERIRSAIVGGVIAGILVGAVAAATGDDSWWAKGLIGVGVGALAGYSKAYFEEKAAKNRTRDQLLNSVDADARQERARLTRTAAAVQILRDCRSRQLDTIAVDLNSGNIEQPDARVQLLAIQDRVREDNELVSEVLDGADERVTSYVDTTAAVSEVDTALLEADRRDREAEQAKLKVKTVSPNVVEVNQEISEIKKDEEVAQAQFDDRLDRDAHCLGVTNVGKKEEGNDGQPSERLDGYIDRNGALWAVCQSRPGSRGPGRFLGRPRVARIIIR